MGNGPARLWRTVPPTAGGRVARIRRVAWIPGPEAATKFDGPGIQSPFFFKEVRHEAHAQKELGELKNKHDRLEQQIKELEDAGQDRFDLL
jgi:hypothetical protein